MKKIGILYGHDTAFAQAVMNRVNDKREKGVGAEPVRVDKVIQAQPMEFAVIIDRISQDVPFYQAYLKNAALAGTAVLNNPFCTNVGDRFLFNALAATLGIPVPKTALLPSNQHPPNTHAHSFQNLAFPLDWLGIFEYVGFSAYMKPLNSRNRHPVFKVNSPGEFFSAHNETGDQAMILQEDIIFQTCYRCFCLGGKEVCVMQRSSERDAQYQYNAGIKPASKKLLATLKQYTIKLSTAFGYDFATVDFGLYNDSLYAIDFCDSVPTMEVASLGPDIIEWVVENVATMAIRRAKTALTGANNLTWSPFARNIGSL